MRILIDGQTLFTPEVHRGIGRYFLCLLRAMLELDMSTEFLLAVPSAERLSALHPWVRDRVEAAVSPSFAPDGDGGCDAYSEALARVVEERGIDIFWTPNPLMPNVRLPEKRVPGVLFVATLHDLIPIVLRDLYLDAWDGQAAEEYLARLRRLDSEYDLFLDVSESTRRDGLVHVGERPERHVVVPEGVGPGFAPYPFAGIPGRPYVLYVGGFDPRKNMVGALEAFALLLRQRPEPDLSLLLVCDLDVESRRRLTGHCRRLGIESRVSLPGFVDDWRLADLYRRARCFFFPSLYEGFGLPVLEALASGVPVAAARTSSLPEVGGVHARYFDPADPAEAADAMAACLDEPVTAEVRQARADYAAGFTWHRAGEGTLAAFAARLAAARPRRVPSRRRRIAWVTPLPPARTGVADYSLVLGQALAAHADVHAFCPSCDDSRSPAGAPLIASPLAELPGVLDSYDEVFYHVGNNAAHHQDIYRLAWDCPGTVVLHDFNIHPFMLDAFYRVGDKGPYREAMAAYGKEGERAFRDLEDRGYNDLLRYPMSHALAARSRRVIVHSHWVRRALGTGNVEVVPHFAVDPGRPSPEEVREWRARHGLDDGGYVVSCLGFINANKLPDLLVAVLRDLLEAGYPVRLVLAGSPSPDLAPLDQDLPAEWRPRLVITGYQEARDYFCAVEASDVVVNLRFPSLGEGSGTLMQAMAAGKAVIVSDHNQYREFPVDTCLRVPHDGNERRFLFLCLRELLSDPRLRAHLSASARRFALERCGLERVVPLYLG